MRTQPQEIITKLEADNSRLAKESILLDAMNEGLDKFFEGVVPVISNGVLLSPMVNQILPVS